MSQRRRIIQRIQKKKKNPYKSQAQTAKQWWNKKHAPHPFSGSGSLSGGGFNRSKRG